MKLPAGEVERVAGKADIRYYLNYVRLDVEGKRLIATNGHALAVVPVEVEEGDTGGALPVEAFKVARKIKGPMEPGFSANGGIAFRDGSTMPRPTEDQAGQYPDWQKLVENVKPSGVTIAFNADLLHDLARAITAKGKIGAIVKLHLNESADGAIRVEGQGGAYGILMPCRF